MAPRGRSIRSVTGRLWRVPGEVKIFSWINGARLSIPMICVTLARVTPSRSAISACDRTSPALSWRCHSMALRRSSTTRDFLSTLGGFGAPGVPARCSLRRWPTPGASGRRDCRLRRPPWGRAYVDDPEPDFRFETPGAGSQSVTYREPCKCRPGILFGVPGFFFSRLAPAKRWAFASGESRLNSDIRSQVIAFPCSGRGGKPSGSGTRSIHCRIP